MEIAWKMFFFLLFSWPLSKLQQPLTIGWMLCPLCLQWGILMSKFFSAGFWVYWIQKVPRNWEKSRKIHFSGNFHGRIWAFSCLKIVPQGQIWYSLYPQGGNLMGKLVFTGLWVLWIKQIGRNWEKSQKSDFSGKISCLQGHFKVLKFDPWARFWYSLGPW